MARSVRLRVFGRVQGVGYRLWAIDAAVGLGLRGWVRNRSDGSVEALVIGAHEEVAAMIKACRLGPAGARVVDVTVTDDADDGSAGFSAQPTK
jgi:acylphosphatase